MQRKKPKKEKGCPRGQDPSDRLDFSSSKDFAENPVSDSLGSQSNKQDDTNGSERKVKTKSNKNRAIFGLRYRLSRDALKILKLLGQDMTQAEVANKASFSKQRVNYWALKFLGNGLLKIKCDGKPKFYELTAISQKILTRSERDWALLCVMEDYPVKYRLLKDHGLIEWEKLGQPRNWEKLGVKVGSVTVEKTSRSIIIHTGQLSGFDPDYLLFQAGQIIADVKAFLESHGVELDAVGLPLHDPIVKFYPPEAEIFNRLFGTVSTEEGSLDNSPPDKIPHVEYTLKTAKHYLEMPTRLKEISDKLTRIEHTQDILSQEQKEIKHNQKGSSENMLTFAQGMRDHLKLVHALTDVAEALTKESDVRREFYELKTRRQDNALIIQSWFYRFCIWLNKDICLVPEAGLGIAKETSLLRRIGSWFNKEVF